MIDKSKTYRTRDGREVRIYATDGQKLCPIHGALKDNDEWNSYSWRSNGKVLSINQEHAADLIEVRPRHKRTVWLNVYKGDNHYAYDTKEEADICAATGRLACVRVDLDFCEGDGL